MQVVSPLHSRSAFKYSGSSLVGFVLLRMNFAIHSGTLFRKGSYKSIQNNYQPTFAFYQLEVAYEQKDVEILFLLPTVFYCFHNCLNAINR